jgi:hypothetical protein
MGDSRPRLSRGRSPAVAPQGGNQKGARFIGQQLRSLEEMPMKSKAEMNTSKKKTAVKTAAPPKAPPAGLHKKQGIWVFSTGDPISGAAMEEFVAQYNASEKIDG